jgi:hypothetical protein
VLSPTSGYPEGVCWIRQGFARVCGLVWIIAPVQKNVAGLFNVQRSFEAQSSFCKEQHTLDVDLIIRLVVPSVLLTAWTTTQTESNFLFHMLAGLRLYERLMLSDAATIIWKG